MVSYSFIAPKLGVGFIVARQDRLTHYFSSKSYVQVRFFLSKIVKYIASMNILLSSKEIYVIFMTREH
uniref:Uncharacterized protein n=1 Tax=Solanum lycopersicum TaxID=4081 RepID=A0A3Q7IL44_SOLLC